MNRYEIRNYFDPIISNQIISKEQNESPTSVNLCLNDDYKLINFNCPKYLIKNFDNLVRHKRVSRYR